MNCRELCELLHHDYDDAPDGGYLCTECGDFIWHLPDDDDDEMKTDTLLRFEGL